MKTSDYNLESGAITYPCRTNGAIPHLHNLDGPTPAKLWQIFQNLCKKMLGKNSMCILDSGGDISSSGANRSFFIFIL